MSLLFNFFYLLLHFSFSLNIFPTVCNHVQGNPDWLQTSSECRNEPHSIYCLCCGRASKRLNNLQEFWIRPWERERILHNRREWNSAQSVIHSALQIWGWPFVDQKFVYQFLSQFCELRQGKLLWTITKPEGDFSKPRSKIQLFFDATHIHKSTLIPGPYQQQHHWKFHPYPSHSSDE